ncbi:MAG: hypothetical protein ABSC41_00235 [Acidimicrobiales bacterium]
MPVFFLDGEALAPVPAALAGGAVFFAAVFFGAGAFFFSDAAAPACAGAVFFGAETTFFVALAATAARFGAAAPFLEVPTLAFDAVLVGAFVGAFFAAEPVLVAGPAFLGDGAATFFAAVTSTSFKVRPVVGSGPHGLGGQDHPRHQMGG